MIVLDRRFIKLSICVLVLLMMAATSVLFNTTYHDTGALLEQPNKQTAKRLYDSADVVATGIITNSSAIMEDSEIWTYLEVKVEEYLKNPQPIGNLTIKSMGGTVGNIGSVAEDSPLFNVGDKVLLILYKESPTDKTYRMSPYSGLLNEGSTSQLLDNLRNYKDNREK